MYKLQQTPEFVTRLSDMASIRVSAASWDSERYRAWRDAGNIPAPADASVPPVLDQIRLIEAEHPITHRHLRDLSMTVARLAEAMTGQPAVNLPMINEIIALEQRIAVLRTSL